MAGTRRTVSTGRKRPSGGHRRKAESTNSMLPDWISIPAESARDAMAEMWESIVISLDTAGKTVFDLNNDGRVDQKDVRLMTKQLQKAVDEIINSEPVKSAVKAAAVGSVIAIPIPLLGPAGGAATAVVVYFTYKGAEGLVRAAGEPFEKRRPAKSSKKKVSARRVASKARSSR